MKNLIFFIILMFMVKTMADNNKNSIRLILVDDIYAVKGVENNIYFDNIILTNNIKNYNFDVDCQLGTQYQDRWSYTPTEKDKGIHPINIKVLDEKNNIVAEKKANIHIVANNNFKDKKISVLVVGDSLVDQAFFPTELYKLLKKSNNLKVKFIGSHIGLGKKANNKNALHEGRGGWSWASYCIAWKDKTKNYRDSSPFLFKTDNKIKLDFQKYYDKYNNSKTADFVIFNLGTNDIFIQNDKNIEVAIKKIIQYANMLIKATKISDKTKIGICLTIPPSASQDAFIVYKCGQTRWQFRRNQHTFVENMIKEFGNRENENIYLISTYLNIDCVNNFPKKLVHKNARNLEKRVMLCNGVHPAPSGYYQMADTVYAWIKYQLTKDYNNE